MVHAEYVYVQLQNSVLWSLNRRCHWRMTRRSFQPSVSTAGDSVCLHFNFLAELYLPTSSPCLPHHILPRHDSFCLPQIPRRGCTALVPDDVHRKVSDDLSIVWLWEYWRIDRNPNHIRITTVPGVPGFTTHSFIYRSLLFAYGMQEDAYERCAVGDIWELCIERATCSVVCARCKFRRPAGMSAAACSEATRMVTSKKIKMAHIPTGRFQMVSLEFFIDIILPAALWPWGRLRL